jgi:hypothetical protein
VQASAGGVSGRATVTVKRRTLASRQIAGLPQVV